MPDAKITIIKAIGIGLETPVKAAHHIAAMAQKTFQAMPASQSLIPAQQWVMLDSWQKIMSQAAGCQCDGPIFQACAAIYTNARRMVGDQSLVGICGLTCLTHSPLMR